MRILYPFAKRYIAGENLATALPSIASLNHSGYFTSVDILGENVFTEKQAIGSKTDYLDLLSQIDPVSKTMDLSIKVTQMGLDIDETFCKDNITKILTAAENQTLRLDMEGSD